MSKPPIIVTLEEAHRLSISAVEDMALPEFLRYGRREQGCNQYLIEGGQLIGLKLRSNGDKLRRFDVPISALQNLQALILTENALESLTLPSMPALEYLDISDNQPLTTLRLEGALPRLRELDASDSGLSALQLPHCPALEKLDVSRNAIGDFAFESACPALRWLDLSGNKGLESLVLPAGFVDLEYVYLSECQLKELAIAGELPALRVLDLEKNQLTAWPRSFGLGDSLETLYLSGNRFEDIPEEVIGSGDRHNSGEDIRNYLRSLAGPVDYLHQAKLILVGNGEVGKSSIRIKLLDETAPLPKKEERTPGLDIAVQPYTLEALSPQLTGLETDIDFQLNIWDFGGQSRYREVQQLFCTPKSLYLFVTACDDQPEQNEEYVSFEYWMSMVHALSYDADRQRSSPVIHVVNKIDLARMDIDQIRRNELKNVARFLEISCETLDNFASFRKAIREVLPEVGEELFRDRFSQDWLKVKDALEKRQADNHLSLREYVEEICAPALNASEAATWLRTLHRIGAVIYFGQNEKLKDWIILNPYWVKDAIFKVLDCGMNSPLPRASFDNFIWKAYAPEERDKLLALMAAYGLCYEQQNDFGAVEYVVPALLKEDAPTFAEKIPQDLPSVLLRVKYAPFLPAGSVNKLMVRLKDYIFRNLIWKSHAILHDPQTATYAYVWEAWSEHCVYLQLYGEKPGVFFHQLSAALEEINMDFKDTHFLKRLDFKVEGEHRERWQEKEVLADLNRADLAFLWEDTNHLTALGEAGRRLHLQPSKINDSPISIKQPQHMVHKEERRKGLNEQALLLQKKINALQLELDKAIDPGMKFKCQEDLEESYARLRDVEAELEGIAPSTTRPFPAPLKTEGKKKVLFICSSPNGKNLLDFGKEFKKINAARQLADHRDNFEEPDIETSVESDEFLNILTKYKPDILHISLHSSKSEGLYFEDIAGNVQPMPVEDFADLIDVYCKDPDGKGRIETVVLSSCNSVLYGEAIQAFSNNVVATKDFFPDKAAVVYADQFYKMLFNQKDVTFAHNAACLAIKRKKYDTGLAIPAHEIPILIKK